MAFISKTRDSASTILIVSPHFPVHSNIRMLILDCMRAGTFPVVKEVCSFMENHSLHSGVFMVKPRF
ncbi:MAG: hypothetical protein CR997_11080 [Acidobacteria bacterium]|nr:MAG: hypothetical protein CR997_11080 [Acidobacteriota bacterium]